MRLQTLTCSQQPSREAHPRPDRVRLAQALHCEMSCLGPQQEGCLTMYGGTHTGLAETLPGLCLPQGPQGGQNIYSRFSPFTPVPELCEGKTFLF